MKKAMGLMGLMGLMFFVGRGCGRPARGPDVTRQEAHAVVDRAFDLIDASANRICLEPGKALGAPLSDFESGAAPIPEKLTQ